MTKSSKSKKQKEQPAIHVGGGVAGDHIIIGNDRIESLVCVSSV